MRCFACGNGVALGSGERVGFRDTCARCDADLHVCLNCRHHDPAAYNECREPQAERVSDRERANRCEQFAPGPPAGPRERGGEERRAARAALDDLFKKR